MAFDKNKATLAAQKYLQKGQYDRAIREYERILKEDPKDIKVRQKLGDLHAREDKKEEAIAEYNYVAKYYSDDGFYLRAIAVYKQILKIDPSQIHINLKLAELYHQQNLLGDSIKQYQLVYSHYERKGETRKALDTLSTMSEMTPENLSLRFKLADAYYQSGYEDRGIEEYINLGKILKEQNRIDDLVNLYEKLVNRASNKIELLTDLADIYIKKGRLDIASARLDMGLKNAPEDKRLLHLKAKIHLHKNELEPASQYLRKIIKVDPEFIEAKVTLADVYEKLGKRDILKDLYTQLMLHFRSKGQEERANHFKALYENITSSLASDITDEGLPSELRSVSDFGGMEDFADSGDFGEAEIITDAVEADVIEADILEDVAVVEVIDEVQGDVGGETLDSEGNLLMLKIDTYVKYGQVKEAARALEDYISRQPRYSIPRRRLVTLYDELLQAGEKDRDYLRLKNEQQQFLQTGSHPDIQPVVEFETGVDFSGLSMDGEPSVEVVEDFEVLVDDQVDIGGFHDEVVVDAGDAIEIVDEVEMGEIGVEPIEIEADGLDGGFEYIANEPEVITEEVEFEHVPPVGHAGASSGVESRLINMAPDDEPLPEGEDYFDLARELEGVVLDDDLQIESKGGAGLLGEDEHISFEDVFDEFKRGVEKQFGKEDYDTYYNLGIAYREMGLYDDAISSLQTSVNDPKRRLDSFILLGVTHRDIGELEKSIDYFREALDSPGIQPDESLGLKYELALSYEMAGEIDMALPLYTEIYSQNSRFREISEKLELLKKGGVVENAVPTVDVHTIPAEMPTVREEEVVPDMSTVREEEIQRKTKESEDPKPQRPKSKISYI
ncbi:MAG: tetratricopeptide repeat protein [Deltaproteobacteria bacterium]|nr:tetratricopeptide repeat protein [Candidatus Zymogenaceae bacterium]